MTLGQAATTAGAEGSSLGLVLGGLTALVTLFLGILKFAGESNQRVDTISGGQINALRDDKNRALDEARAAHDETRIAREEAAVWQRTTQERDREILALRLEIQQLRWEQAMRGTGSSGGATPS